MSQVFAVEGEEQATAAGINSGGGTTTVESGTQSGQSTYQEPQFANVGTMGGSAPLPGSFYDEVMRTKAHRPFTQEGSAFVKTLEENLKKLDIHMEILPKTNTYMFHNKTHAVGLLFEEHMPPQRDTLPRTRNLPAAYQEIDTMTKTGQFPWTAITIVLVTPEDYARESQFEQYIDRVLKYGYTDNNTQSFSIGSIANNMFRIVTSKHAVDQVVNDMSVSGIIPFYQYGFVLEMCINPDWKNNQFYQNRFMDDSQYVPILAVPMYTSMQISDCFGMNGQGMRFTPQVHVSEILSIFPSVKMLPFVIALATQVAIMQQLWREAFNQYDRKSPNIGSLWIEPDTGEPGFVNNAQERDLFIAQRCDTPILVIDSQYGRPTIPGLTVLGSNAHLAIFGNEFFNMFGFDVLGNTNCDSLASPYFEYTGVVDYEGPHDSRAYDYFKVLNSCNNDRAILDRFLTIPPINDPGVKLNALTAMNYNLRSLYDTPMNVVNPALIAAISHAIGQRVSFIGQQDNGGYYNNFSNIMNMSNQMRDMLAKNSTFITPQGGFNRGSMYNPFNNAQMFRARRF